MTLHDRIINLRKSQYWADEFSNGYDQAKFESSKLAKEADELMAEMARFIDRCGLDDEDDYDAMVILSKYNTYKEGKQ